MNIGGNNKLYYECIEGDATQPYLVFLHEGLGCTALWGDFPRLLCNKTGCPGLIYDRLGYGLSSVSSSLESQSYMEDYARHELPLVLAKTIAGKMYVLIGHSDGGSIALIHGSEQASNLCGVITEAAHVFVENETVEGIQSAQRAWTAGKLCKLRRYHGEKTERIVKSWAATWLSAHFRRWNIEHLLERITVPLLAIQGTHDQYGTQLQVDTITTQTSGQSQAAFIDKCGHIPHREAREEVLNLMSDFICKCLKSIIDTNSKENYARCKP